MKTFVAIWCMHMSNVCWYTQRKIYNTIQYNMIKPYSAAVQLLHHLQLSLGQIVQLLFHCLVLYKNTCKRTQSLHNYKLNFNNNIL